MTDLFEVMLAQRACRAFAADDVPDADVVRILEAATHAPSAENTQPWVFVVVRDPNLRARIGSISQRLWEGGGRTYAAAHVGERMLAEVDGLLTESFGGAPVVLVVCANLASGVPAPALGSSVYPAVQNLLLAANALGYGSALTTIATFAADELRAVIAAPDNIMPMAVVPLGRPEKPLGAPRRKPPVIQWR